MPRETTKILAKDMVLTRPILAKFLRTEGQSLGAGQGEGLKDLARWLINANIEKFNGRVDMSNQDIIQVLQRVKVPGAPREVVKAWLVTRLFDRRASDSSDSYFLAKPKDRDDLIAARNLMAADEAEMGVHANRALLEAVTLFARAK